MWRAVNLEFSARGARFDVTVRDRADGAGTTIEGLELPMHGRHNVTNALAAVAVAHEMGIDEGHIRAAFSGFEGVKRRFTRTGEAGGVTVIDDYAHHPVEIAAVLRAARGIGARHVVAVVQPHRYSRLMNLFEDFCTCFNDADTVIVSDVYPAGEQPIEGIDRDALVEGLRARGHRHVVALESQDRLAEVVAANTGPGDLVVCLGAGSVTAWAEKLPGQLAELAARSASGEER